MANYNTGHPASAPGKAILFGEHAVVYGRAAIAVPLHDLRLTARTAQRGQPQLAQVARAAWQLLGRAGEAPGVVVESQIPPGAGLGSSAALCVAVLRLFAPGALTDQDLRAMAHRLEHLYHGQPSGLDTSVVALERPVWFRRGREPETIRFGGRLRLLLLDSGERASTAEVVGWVRRRWEADRADYEALFDEIDALAGGARRRLESGDGPGLGQLMLENHRLLREMGVSSGRLDELVALAVGAGAWGAKLSGAGRGGHVVAAAPPEIHLEGARETWLAGDG